MKYLIFLPQGSRAASALTSTTLTSLGGTSSRRGSGETALTLDAETSIREIKVTRGVFLFQSPKFYFRAFHKSFILLASYICRCTLCFVTELSALLFLVLPHCFLLLPHFTEPLQEIHELKDQIQDVESKYNQNLKEVKVFLYSRCNNIISA